MAAVFGGERVAEYVGEMALSIAQTIDAFAADDSASVLVVTGLSSAR